MLLDLIRPNNRCTFSSALAHKVDLNSAIYCDEILNILSQVEKKNTYDSNGFFVLDRQYMYERTTLTPTQQRDSEVRLSSIGVITVDPLNRDKIKLDQEMMCSIITNHDFHIHDIIKENIKLVSEKSYDKRRIADLKNNITILDQDYRDAMCGWIDALAEANVTGVSLATVKAFQDSVKTCDLSKSEILKVIAIATQNGWKLFNWSYKEYLKKSKEEKKPHLTRSRYDPTTND